MPNERNLDSLSLMATCLLFFRLETASLIQLRPRMSYLMENHLFSRAKASPKTPWKGLCSWAKHKIKRVSNHQSHIKAAFTSLAQVPWAKGIIREFLAWVSKQIWNPAASSSAIIWTIIPQKFLPSCRRNTRMGRKKLPTKINWRGPSLLNKRWCPKVRSQWTALWVVAMGVWKEVKLIQAREGMTLLRNGWRNRGARKNRKSFVLTILSK